jgi:hypothetical protein
LIEYIKKNNYEEYFKIICIDNIEDIPKNINVVPTVLDTELDAPLEGNEAKEYVLNLKFFNHPTNNVEYTKNGVPKPLIEEDKKANTAKSGSGFIYVNQDVEKKFVDKEDKSNFDKVFDIKSENENQNDKINIVKKPVPVSKPVHVPRHVPVSRPVSKPVPQKKVIKQEKEEKEEKQEQEKEEPENNKEIGTDSKLNLILEQRKTEDRKMVALMKLRKPR